MRSACVAFMMSCLAPHRAKSKVSNKTRVSVQQRLSNLARALVIAELQSTATAHTLRRPHTGARRAAKHCTKMGRSSAVPRSSQKRSPVLTHPGAAAASLVQACPAGPRQKHSTNSAVSQAGRVHHQVVTGARWSRAAASARRPCPTTEQRSRSVAAAGSRGPPWSRVCHHRPPPHLETTNASVTNACGVPTPTPPHVPSQQQWRRPAAHIGARSP